MGQAQCGRTQRMISGDSAPEQRRTLARIAGRFKSRKPMGCVAGADIGLRGGGLGDGTGCGTCKIRRRRQQGVLSPLSGVELIHKQAPAASVNSEPTRSAWPRAEMHEPRPPISRTSARSIRPLLLDAGNPTRASRGQRAGRSAGRQAGRRQVKLIWKTPVSPPSSDHPKR